MHICDFKLDNHKLFAYTFSQYNRNTLPTWGYVQTTAIVSNNYICGECPVESFIGTAKTIENVNGSVENGGSIVYIACNIHK